MTVLLLFFGPPIVAAGILVALLHAPFTTFEDESRALKLYFSLSKALSKGQAL